MQTITTRPAAKAATPPTIAPLAISKPLLCPCCKQPVTIPAPEIVIDHYGVTRMEARIFEAVWKGKGLPVVTERIFTAMYIDDPDGGPSPDKMYLAFKVALCHLRQKLEGSGIGIANVGYRRGYRLVLEGKFPSASAR
jgi:hypothetical protein